MLSGTAQCKQQHTPCTSCSWAISAAHGGTPRKGGGIRGRGLSHKAARQRLFAAAAVPIHCYQTQRSIIILAQQNYNAGHCVHTCAGTR